MAQTASARQGRLSQPNAPPTWTAWPRRMKGSLPSEVVVYLRALELTNFRNFRRASLELEDGPTVLLGENGQGKTNLLEAVELLATAKSARTGSERELVHWAVLSGDPSSLAQAFGRVRATVVREGRETRAEVLIRPDSTGPDGATVTKSFRLNGAPKRALEFVGAINVVSFSPLDVGLVAGPPSGRRRYLDVMIAQVNSHYLRTLQRYQKVLLQRNALLRQLRAQPAAESGLAVWTEQLVTEGSYLVLERARAVTELGPLADHWHRQLGGGGQRLEVAYRPALGEAGTAIAGLEGGESGLLRLRQAFAEELQRTQGRELAAGLSLTGPHRDDLQFRLDGYDLHVYGSRGQQRLAALALKLAEADLVERRAGSRPILLMDDVLSELDQRRQLAVLRLAADGGQTLLTTTALELTRPVLAAAPVFQVEAGAVGPLR